MTTTQFWRLLKKHPGQWTVGSWGQGTIRLDKNNCIFCPIIAVADLKGKKFKNAQYPEAAKFLGLTETFYEDMASAADNGPVGLTSRQLTIRNRLLKIVNEKSKN